MKAFDKLIKQIKEKQNFFCVGLDADIEKIPEFLKDFDDPIFEFNRRIIDATREYCVAYKINTAFFEAQGAQGWETLYRTFRYIPKTHFSIADAKRADIGNTSSKYAKAIFEYLDADSITLAPYMGYDSIEPFLRYKDKVSILLALTSNPGADDFQLKKMEDGRQLFEQVLETSSQWANESQLMYVTGATRPEKLAEIRKYVPNHFFLVPGVGVQGGSLQEVCRYGLNKNVGLLINSSRAIIYADKSRNFDKVAAQEAEKIAKEMKAILLQL